MSTVTVRGSARLGAPLCWEFYECASLLVYLLSYFRNIVYHYAEWNLGLLPSQHYYSQGW